MTKNKKVPVLRFREFEIEWSYKTLEEISKKKISYGIVQAGEHVPDGMPYIKSQDLNTSLKKEELQRTSMKIAKKYHRSEVYPNDIVFSLRGNIGITQIVPDSIKVANLTQGTARISVSKNHDNYFVNYSLHTQRITKKILSVSKGSTFQEISLLELRRIKIPLPTFPEQQKIATFLTAIDTKIQQLTKKKALLEAYKKGVMQQIFKREIRFRPAPSEVEGDEGGKAFPEWEERKLGTLTYKTGRKNKENMKYPIYSINNKEGFLPQSDQFDGMDSNERGYDISLYKIIKENTFAYNPARINVGSIGFSGKLNDIIVSSLYVCFKTNDELDDDYLLQYLNTFDFNKAVLRNAEGGVRSYLFYENFSIIKIPLPSITEQQRIACFLKKIDKGIQQATDKISQMQYFKKGLLQKMFV